MAKRRFLAPDEKFGIIPITDTFGSSGRTRLVCALNVYLFVNEVYSCAFSWYQIHQKNRSRSLSRGKRYK